MIKIFQSVLLVLSMLFWAINFHVAKFALVYYSPMGVASFRFFFGVLVLLIFLYVKRGNAVFKTRFGYQEWLYMFATSFFGIFLTIYFFNKGLMSTSAINGSLIETTNPIVVAILSIFFLRQRATLRQWAAILISLSGVLMVLTQGAFGRILTFQFNQGDIYLMLMVICFSLSQMIIKKYLLHIDAIMLTTVASLMSLMLFLIFSFGEILTVGMPQSFNFWGSILSMGILGTGIAYTAFYFCVKVMGATSSTLYLNLIPFFAVLIALFFGGDIHSSQLFGGVIIVFGIFVYLKSGSAS